MTLVVTGPETGWRRYRPFGKHTDGARSSAEMHEVQIHVTPFG